MKRKAWRKHHKWFGLVIGFFIVMFCWSGIVLNHRDAFSGVEISRRYLPRGYRFSAWNGGLVRGTIAHPDGRTLIYGNEGVWASADSLRTVVPLNGGFPDGVDNRNVRAMAVAGGRILAASTGGLYQLGEDGVWRDTGVDFGGERLSDMEVAGDTLVIVGRSHIYKSQLCGDATSPISLSELTLREPADYDGRVTLFRTLWELHSGHLFGLGGRLIMDAVAVVLILLYVTGVAYWLILAKVKRRSSGSALPRRLSGAMRGMFKWHDAIGRKTIILTMFVCLTGWCLRPPLMILGVIAKVPPVPFTNLDDANPWADKLRAVRYDALESDWLISTSDGFYSLASLDGRPERVDCAPPVSVMGVNVLRRGESGDWLVGSFRGLYRWSRRTGSVNDYFDGSVPQRGGMPVGEHDVCGWMSGPVEYTAGTGVAAMPANMENLPMSLWNVALEVHTGRIYTFMGIMSTLLWVFVAGAAAAWVLWSGWKLRRP